MEEEAHSVLEKKGGKLNSQNDENEIQLEFKKTKPKKASDPLSLFLSL